MLPLLFGAVIRDGACARALAERFVTSGGSALKVHQLSDMKGGWFVGHFSPTVISTSEFEVGVKIYPAGAKETAHHHKVAEEVTVIASGRVIMCGQEFGAGSIIHLAPGDSTSFEALEPTVTVVVKRPSVPNDKYLD
jgi:mannose-6-phosphate isomerase-like protein (cupin superfamily)